MPSTRTRITVLITFAALTVTVAFLLITWIAMMTGHLAGNSFPGALYLLISANVQDIAVVFAVVISVFTAGVNLLGRETTQPWLIWTCSILCFLGLILCFWLYLNIKVADVARPLWSRSEALLNYTQLQAQNKALLGSLAAWLGTFLATVLGVAVLRAQAGGGTANGGAPPPPASEPRNE